jgi:hypothetical protein
VIVKFQTLSVLVLISGVTLISTQQAGSAQLEDTLSPKAQKLIEDVLKATSPLKEQDNPGFAKGLSLLFHEVGPAGVRQLQRHTHESIALQAAWEQVRIEDAKKAKDERPDPQSLAWFLGFLEGRIRVQAPAWWAEALLGSRTGQWTYDTERDRSVRDILPGEPKAKPYHLAGLDAVICPRDTSLKLAGDKAILSIGRESVPVPLTLLRRASRGEYECGVSALITPSRCYLAVHGDLGFRYQLRCIDRKKGDILWTSDVMAFQWGHGSGLSDMWVTVTEQGGRIVIFGFTNGGLQVEAFRAEHGKHLFRFASTYWSPGVNSK